MLSELTLANSGEARDTRGQAGREARGDREGYSCGDDSKVLTMLEISEAARGLWEGRGGASRARP